MRSKTRQHAMAIGFIALITVRGIATGAEPGGYESEIDSWHQARVDRLTAADGWLTLIGLFWLEEGPNAMGSAPGSPVLLPVEKAPAQAAMLRLDKGRVELEALPMAEITEAGTPVDTQVMRPDTTGEPTVLDLGDLQFFVIERGGRYGLRVRDRQHPSRFDFAGIERFPVDPSWRITGTLERHQPPRTIPIPNVLGMVTQQPSPGTVRFEVEGREYRIDALEASGDRLYLVFGDGTSGRETYGGGRFLYSDPVRPDDTVVLDFNKAYNPPCAFTDFATCPLPPRQNKLELRIEAGEKDYGRH